MRYFTHLWPARWRRAAYYAVVKGTTPADMGGYQEIPHGVPFISQEELEAAYGSYDFVARMCKAALGPSRFNEQHAAAYQKDQDYRIAFRLLFDHQYFLGDSELGPYDNVDKRKSADIPALYHNIQVMHSFHTWLEKLPRSSPLFLPENRDVYKALIIIALLHDILEDSNIVKTPGATPAQMIDAQKRLKREIATAFGNTKFAEFIVAGIDLLTDPPQKDQKEMATEKKIDKFNWLIDEALKSIGSERRSVVARGRTRFHFNVRSFLPHILVIKIFDKGNNLRSDIEQLKRKETFPLAHLEIKAERTRKRFEGLKKLGKWFDPSLEAALSHIHWELEKALPSMRRFAHVRQRWVSKFMKVVFRTGYHRLDL